MSGEVPVTPASGDFFHIHSLLPESGSASNLLRPLGQVTNFGSFFFFFSLGALGFFPWDMKQV